MLLVIPGRERSVYGKMKTVTGGKRVGLSLFVERKPVPPRKTKGWMLAHASAEEYEALKKYGYVIPWREEVEALRIVIASLAGASGRGASKRRRPEHYALMVERRRRLGMLGVSNAEKRRLSLRRVRG